MLVPKRVRRVNKQKRNLVNVTAGRSHRHANRSICGENFSIAKDDLYRAVDAAKSFKYDAPVTLAIATSILEKK